MAKDVLRQKRRISHFQIPTENENISTGCLDYVSSIIKTMDSSFMSVQSDYSKMHTKSMNNEESNNSSQKPTSASKRGISQSSKSFGKNLCFSRKFPLMEKSQKILKQLKHNRNISKPRAHLAGFPKSPVRTVSEKKSSRAVRIPTKRENAHQTAQKEKSKHVSKVKSSSDVRGCSTLSKISTCTVNNSNLIRSSKDTRGSIHSNDSNGSDVNKHLYSADLNSKKNSVVDANAFKSSDNETSDSEYEKFIEKNKKGLKRIKSKKQSTTNRKASVRKSNRIQRKNECNSDQSDSDYNSFASSSNNSELGNNYKKCKVAKLQTDSDSENNGEPLRSDLHIGISTQDPVFESDISDTELITNDNNDDSTSDEDVESNNLTPPDSRITIGNVVPINCITDAAMADEDVESSNLTPPDSHITIGNVVPAAMADEDVESSNLTAPVNPIAIGNVVSVNNAPDVSSSHNDSLDKKMVEPNNSSALVINLCDSDDEDSKIGVCTKLSGISEHTGFPNENSPNKTELFKGIQNVPNPDSDDSDLEIIEVLPSKSKDLCQTVNVSYRNSELPIKKERNVDISSIKSENIKHEAVYMTDICSDLDQAKQVNVSHSAVISSEILETSSKIVLDDESRPRTRVKRENDSDDDIVILPTEEPNVSNISACKKVKTEYNAKESLNSLKYSAHKLLMSGMSQSCFTKSLTTDSKNSNIKNEQATDSSGFENSSFKHVSQIKNVASIDKFELSSDSETCSTTSNQMNNHINLIELYKREFQAYQEIVQTEATLSASLKALENRQAEKVTFIRSLVKKHITYPVPKDSFVNNALTDVFESLPISKTDVPKIENEMKPDTLKNVELLLYPNVTIKHEPKSEEYENSSEVKSANKQTLRLLNERCNVCEKDAVAACQGCAKVFFCSDECGMKFWRDGHKNECGED